MTELGDLYQQLILDHNKSPRNYGELDAATHRAEGHNPLCGDTCTIYVAVDGETISDIRFSGHGCAISKASASLMTSHLKGKTLADAEAIFGRFRTLLTGEGEVADDNASLGKLEAFAGVREFPMRVKCATLPWHTLRAALEQSEASVTTE